MQGGHSLPTVRTPTQKTEVTPAFLRSLMPSGPDPEDELYRKKQHELYRMMELAARQNKFEVTFTVVDADIEEADAQSSEMLDRVFYRLINWLARPKNKASAFHLRPSPKAQRSITVSWDPIETPASITPVEKTDPNSVTYRRIRRHSSRPYDKNDYAGDISPHEASSPEPTFENFLAPPPVLHRPTHQQQHQHQQQYAAPFHAHGAYQQPHAATENKNHARTTAPAWFEPPVVGGAVRARPSTTAVNDFCNQRAATTAMRAARVAGASSPSPPDRHNDATSSSDARENENSL